MDFDFTDDQEQLRDAVRKWVDKGYDFERRRGIAKLAASDRAAYGELAELGLAGLYIPEADGGMGMGPVEGMVVMEELGRGIVLEPLAQTLIAGGVLSGYARPTVKAAWLPNIASRRSAGGARLTRSARPATSSTCAKQKRRQADSRMDVVCYQKRSARRRPGRRLHRAGHGRRQDRAVPGGAHRRWRRTRGYGTQDGGRAADLTLKDAPATLITPDGLTALEHAVDIGIAATCAEAVGVMDKTVAITVEYMNTRKQFGVAIGSFQALRHRVADMKMQLELARSMSYYASLKLNAPAARAPRSHGAGQVPAGHCHAFCRPAGGAAARRHRRDRRIHRQPLLQEAHAAGDDLRRHPAPPGRGLRPDAGHGRRVRLKLQHIDPTKSLPVCGPAGLVNTVLNSPDQARRPDGIQPCSREDFGTMRHQDPSGRPGYGGCAE